MAVGGDWWLVVGGCWRLAAVGGWRSPGQVGADALAEVSIGRQGRLWRDEMCCEVFVPMAKHCWSLHKEWGYSWLSGRLYVLNG